VDAVSVNADVLRYGAVGMQGAGEDVADITLLDDPRDTVARTGFESHVSRRGEAQRPVVLRGLLGITDEELDVIDPLDRERILSVRHSDLLVVCPDYALRPEPNRSLTPAQPRTGSG
jgi:hypothetical protein